MALSVKAPEGAHWEFDEVRTLRGTKSLGEVPLLYWDDPNAALRYYGEEGMKEILNGTSTWVTFQGIARRGRLRGLTDDQIAQQQVDFRPGQRQVGARTPVTRAAKAAKAAASKVSGDVIAALLERIARGEISEEDLAALAS
jgi:hypothetical protein